jgi:predicted AAA+ superfamily ATPase
MWIPRAVEPRLQRSAKTRPVVVLTGARQTGKTSTFLRLFPKHAFVSLDLPAEAEQAEKEPGTFLQRHRPPVLIDEVQYAPGLFRHLKVAVDADRTRNGQFLLTGSQKFTLMKNVSESLAGRADIVELENLSFAEIAEPYPKPNLNLLSCAADSQNSMPTRTSIPQPSTIRILRRTLGAMRAPLLMWAAFATLRGFCARALSALPTC